MRKSGIFMIMALPLLYAANAFSQSINEKELDEIRSGYVINPSTRAMENILAENHNFKSLAANRKMAGKIDDYFKYSIDVKNITDQKQSGRCWMFTSMNVLRPYVMKKYNLQAFDFSHNYTYFWDIFEKSNLFLENIISTSDKSITDREVTFYFSSPVNDGGVWNLFYNVAEKYGVVPAEVMPETANSNNTSSFIRIINERLRKGGYEIRQLAGKKGSHALMEKEKISVLKDVYRVLALCLGEPPQKFTWRYEDGDKNIKSISTTPMAFYKSLVPKDYDASNYIMIMNDPTRAYYKVYEIENYRNAIEGINWTYLNLPNEDIKDAALASIKGGEIMYASCDVGKQSDTKKGILDPNLYDYNDLFGINLNMDKKARILTRQSGSSHAMAIVACDTDKDDRPVKWEFENSWGPSAGDKGFLVFTDKWFDEYLFRVVINKKYLGEKALKALGQKHIMLPPWDYMF